MELSVHGLTKTYGRTAALSNIHLELEGGVVGLLGQNGSGKTTLLRCLATALKPDAGVICFAGQAYTDDLGTLRALRSRLGYLPQELDLPETMTPAKLLAYLAHLKRLADTRQGEELLERLGLSRQAQKPFSELSSGQVRLAGIAQAFLGAPRLVLLDELTRGLDLEERQSVFRLVLRQPGLVIFSTHHPRDIEQIAGQVVVLLAGQVVYAGSVDRLRQQAGGQVFEARVPTGAVSGLLARVHASRLLDQGEETVIRVVGEKPVESEFRAVDPTLEDAYLLTIKSTR